MKIRSLCLSAVLGFTGCHTPVPTAPQRDPDLVLLYNELQAVPVPVPRTTPFDADDRQRDAYLMGFMKGWEMGIQSVIGYGDYDYFGATHLPEDLAPAWKAGAEKGSYLTEPLVLAKEAAWISKKLENKKQ